MLFDFPIRLPNADAAPTFVLVSYEKVTMNS